MSKNRNRSTRVLVLIMSALVLIGILVARTYYVGINKSVDPRVKQARELYGHYDELGQTGNYYRVFELLDSVEMIYTEFPHYRNSFEVGVVYNNRAAAQLTIALHKKNVPDEFNPFAGMANDSLLLLAEVNALKAITLYSNWENEYSQLSQESIKLLVADDVNSFFDYLSPKLKSKYIKHRVKDIEQALSENNRRLSVCYTNLGIVYRQREMYKEAVLQYDKALQLWDRNLNAENNRNVLLGLPLVKRNFIQKMFPPKKEE